MSMVAGWYPDPFSSAGYLRWWDGAAWTSRTMVPGAASAAPAAPAPTIGPGHPGGVVLASWGKRFAAFVIDMVLLGLLCAPFFVVVLWPVLDRFVAAIPSDGSAPPESVMADLQTGVIGASLSLTLVWVVVSFVYFVPAHARAGRTVGKLVVGIRVRAFETDRLPGWREAILRWAVFAAGSAVAGGFFLLLDGLWPLWDRPWQQALHDKVARTLVVPLS
jgi:uncharacterized RDD family membrane protein YckC